MCMEGLGVCIILTKKNCFWPKIIEIGPPKNFSIFEQPTHKLRKSEDWTVTIIFLSLLIDHMMTKYIIVV
jgi:hypothetical protein